MKIVNKRNVVGISISMGLIAFLLGSLGGLDYPKIALMGVYALLTSIGMFVISLSLKDNN